MHSKSSADKLGSLCSLSQLGFNVVVCYNRRAGKVQFAIRKRHALGFRASILNYNRTPVLLSHVRKALFGCICCHACDGHLTLEPCTALGSGHDCYVS